MRKHSENKSSQLTLRIYSAILKMKEESENNS